MPRVKNSDPEITKAKILKAGRALFVERGFAGASMGKIATLAGVNHSLLFHHFENKAGLWQAVKMQIVDEAREQKDTLPSEDLAWPDFLRELVVSTFDFYRDNPDMTRLIQWQRLEYHSHEKSAVGPSKETTRWLKALAHYQKCGDIGADINLKFALTMIVSIISSAALDPLAFIAGKTNSKHYLEFVVERLRLALK